MEKLVGKITLARIDWKVKNSKRVVIRHILTDGKKILEFCMLTSCLEVKNREMSSE